MSSKPFPRPKKILQEPPPAEGAVLWEPVKGETLSWRIVRRIRAALFAGQIKPGDPLGSERLLAERFAVSRMAIRDALRSLQAAGIIEIRVGAKGGVFIAQSDPERFADAQAIQFKLIGITVDEMFDAQIAIEVMATELAARRSTAADQQKLQQIITELTALQRFYLSSAEALHFTRLSMRFHEALVEASHSRALIAQFKALRFILEPIYARRTTNAVARRTIASHRALLACIVAGDADGARTLLRRRLEVIRARQLTAPATGPQHGQPQIPRRKQPTTKTTGGKQHGIYKIRTQSA